MQILLSSFSQFLPPQSRYEPHSSRWKVYPTKIRWSSWSNSQETFELPAWGTCPRPHRAGGWSAASNRGDAQTVLDTTLNTLAFVRFTGLPLDTKGQVSCAGTQGIKPPYWTPWHFEPWHHMCVYVSVCHEVINRFQKISSSLWVRTCSQGLVYLAHGW